jgi:hypothetical protein
MYAGAIVLDVLWARVCKVLISTEAVIYCTCAECTCSDWMRSCLADSIKSVEQLPQGTILPRSRGNIEASRIFERPRIWAVIRSSPMASPP